MRKRVKRHFIRFASLISVCLLSLFLFGSFGCAQDKSIVFDYASQPEEFVVKLKPNRKYTIVRGKDSFPFSLTLKNDIIGDHGTSHLIWNRIDRKANMLRAKERVPYLIHADGKDYLYIYGAGSGDLNFIELSDTNSVKGADNAQLYFYEEPKDPNNLPVRISISVLGPAASELRYHVGKLGKPTPNEDPEGYRYCVEADRKEKLVTTKDAQVMIFANAETTEGKVETLPSGSVFTRLRTSKGLYTDLLLEDGRVIRVKERYLFSEPHAIMDVTDFADKPFEYKVLKNK
ncbi:MAG TPA: hypothetical protein DEG55_02550 [Acidaminococcaceae bacterium]|nr:hypothetical protein [Acidaminococcaceae bacterium]